MKKFLFILVFISSGYSAFAVASVTQKEWRWRSDNGGETNATWHAAQDQPASRGLCHVGEVIRLRMVMQVNPDPVQPSYTASSTTNRNISYSTSVSGPWTPITTSSPMFVVANSAFVTDGQGTTEQMVSTGGVFGGGVIVSGPNATTLTFTTQPNTITRYEYEWVIMPVTGVQATTYYFKFEGANTWPMTLPSLTIGGPTSSTQNISQCSDYTSPSGNYIWNATGTYNDIIPNSVGCDSVITINLVIGNSSNSISASACDSYMSPSGSYNWTASGAYYDTLPNATGCDSIIITYLTITNSSFSSISATRCASYTSPSGNYTWTTSGTYNDTIPNASGCDSVITTNLVIGNSSNTMMVNACNSYTSPSGNYNWTTSGIYNDTIANAAGCDSIITTNLTIANTSFSSITATRCASYTSPSGNYTWTTSGTYNDTIPNASGCDSVIVIDLTINNTSNFYNQDVCDSIVSPSGNYTWSTSGVHNDTIPNAAGCDSIITVALTVYTIDATTTSSNETITANNQNATYQWVDCNNNNTPIANETGMSFTATTNGNYAVIVSDVHCTKMSPCTMILTTGLNANASSSLLAIYPNPNNGSFTIETASVATIEISNSIGQVVMSKMMNSGKNNIALENMVNGVYFVSSVDAAGNRTTQKIIIAN